GKLVTTTDLLSIASMVCGKIEKKHEIVGLKDLVVVTGSSVIPTASVKLFLNKKEYVVSETGIGPVDAALRAISKIVDSMENVRLREFRIEALTGGANAIAEVIIKVEDKEGNIVSARSAGPDIVMVSVEAMINGLNQLLQKKKEK
ncbi:MAG: alpha-isopropylmalate synthase regulatory domain-containing protein, partial [Candidatus Bathyarchaeota archaeon]